MTGKLVLTLTSVKYVDVDDIVYTVVEVGDRTVKLKHPEIGGHFTFSKDRINKVVSEAICK